MISTGQRKLGWATVVILSAMAVGVALESALDSRIRQPQGAPENATQTVANALAHPYLRATWRLAPGELERVVTWPSHIVIAHRDSALHASPFLLDKLWQRAPTDVHQSARTRQQAFALAARIAAEATVNPASFKELALQYSDDIATRDWGGVLGPTPGSRVPSELLDVLAHLRIGEISRPVESAWGFHVFRMEPPRPPEWVSGREVSISYVGCAGWLAPNPVLPVRSRTEAAALAQKLYERLQKDPASLPVIAAQFSDSPSKLIGGEIGTWSTTMPGDEGRMIEALSRLRVGEISRPIDTPFGFRLLQRIESKPARFYAARRVALEYESASGTAQKQRVTREQAVAQLSAIFFELQRDTEQFDRYANELCCSGTLEWEGARGDPRVLAAIETARIGEIVGPVEVPEAKTIAVYQRVQSQQEERRHLAVDARIPWAQTPDVDDFVRHGDGVTLARVVGDLTRALLARLQMAESTRQGMQNVLRTLASELEHGTADTRGAAMMRARQVAYELLGADGFATFTEGVNGYVFDWIMRGPQ